MYVYVCMCVCVCVYVNVYVYVYVYVYGCVYVYVYKCMYTISACTRMYECMYMDKRTEITKLRKHHKAKTFCVHARAGKHVYVRVHARKDTSRAATKPKYTCVHIHTQASHMRYMYIRRHTRIYVFTYTYVCAQLLLPHVPSAHCVGSVAYS